MRKLALFLLSALPLMLVAIVLLLIAAAPSFASVTHAAPVTIAMPVVDASTLPVEEYLPATPAGDLIAKKKKRPKLHEDTFLVSTPAVTVAAPAVVVNERRGIFGGRREVVVAAPSVRVRSVSHGYSSANFARESFAFSHRAFVPTIRSATFLSYAVPAVTVAAPAVQTFSYTPPAVQFRLRAEAVDPCQNVAPAPAVDPVLPSLQAKPGKY